MNGYPSIALPVELEGHEVIASVSGGKDSTALMLALREAGIPFRAVFADTGWEHPDVYRYLDVLRERIGPIDVVGVEGGMIARIRHRAGFPSRMQRWCTRELKIEPLKDYHGRVEDETGRETVSAIGVRADESARRAQLPELNREAEGARSWGAWVWRPLLRWSVDDVLRIHLAHGVPVNPLYRAGLDRVGCWPCIFARKDEVRLMAELDPARVDTIRELEAEMTALRAERNAEQPGRYEHPDASFFLGDRRTVDDEAVDGPLGYAPGIDRVVEWSRTSRGGRQLQLLDEGPRGGCMRWGLCDTGGAS